MQIVRSMAARCIITLCAVACGPACATAAGPAIPDSTGNELHDSLTVELPEVKVTAERRLSPEARDIAPRTVIGRTLIQNAGLNQLADVLLVAPGVFIANYGGMGALKSISLRGTSSAQAVILLDGIRLNSTQNGQYDLSVIPVQSIESIEIRRGGAAVLFGAGALGGAVEISTTKNVESSQVLLSTSLGSFGRVEGAAQASYPLAQKRIDASLIWQHSDGDYPFAFNQFGRDVNQQRSNADFTNLSGALAYSTNVFGAGLQSRASIRSTKRGVPGAVVQGRLENESARLGEVEAIVSTSMRKELSTGASISVTGSARIGTLKYSDEEVFGSNRGTLDNNYTFGDYGINSRMKFNGRTWLAEAIIEGQFSELRSDALQPELGDYVNRLSVSAAVYAAKELQVLTAGILTLQCGIRGDHYSEFGFVLSPLAGVQLYDPGSRINLRGQWSYNFRPASFNELYYLNFGNTDLLPERSHSANVGITWQWNKSLSLEGDVFGIYTNNLIVSVPNSPVSWSAQNIGQAFSRGIEFSILAVLFDNRLHTRASYTLQKATNESPKSLAKGKDIVYVPRQMASLISTLDFDPLSFGVSVGFNGGRYSIAGNTADSRVGAFWNTSANAEWCLFLGTAECRLRLTVFNVFNEQYFVIKNYPMPGRSARIGATFLF